METSIRVTLRPGLVGVGIAVLVLSMFGARAEAIPAFARKYQTSCQTCHIAFPKLNPFGEAFRLRGYRLPGETEDMIKEPPVSLGAPAYKRVWPEAVWPSDMPGTIPISINTIFSDQTTRSVKNDFHFPEEVSVLMGGTLGETLSFFGEVVAAPTVENGESGVEIEIEHSQISFNGPFGSGPGFNVRVGRFTPEVTQPFSHGALLTSEGPASLLGFVPIASAGGSAVGGDEGAGIAIPHGVDGIEFYGVLAHRFLYSGGMANGLGPGVDSMDGNNAKDVYGRVSYKVGGLALDGDGYTPSDKNWRETSLKLGAYAYRGDGSGVLFPATDAADAAAGGPGELLEDRTFSRVGVDANVYFRDLNVVTGYVRGRDTLAEYTQPAGAVRLDRLGGFVYHAMFAEADYVLMPWLHGAVRYEWLRPADSSARNFKRTVSNLTALIRANVKASFEYVRDAGSSDDYEIVGALRFAF